MSRRKVTTLPIAGDWPPCRLVESGGMLFTSTISGIDPRSGELDSDPAKQFETAFANLRQLVERAGASMEELGLVTVAIPDASYRPQINPPWLATFPDEGRRPARKTNQYPLPPGVHVQLTAIGVKGQRPRALEIPGFAHRDPLPAGVRIGDVVLSSVVGGQDPSGALPEDPAEQLRQGFENLEILLKDAGGSKDDMLHVYVFLRDRAHQPLLIDRWLEAFPDEGNRPARKTIFYDELRGSTVVQLQMVAVLGQGKRGNYEIPGIGHHDPIPMAASRGPLLWSSGISGRGPGQMDVGLSVEEQAPICFGHMKTLVGQAGMTPDDIGLITLLVRDYAVLPVAMQAWRAAFPNPEDEPALHVMALGLTGDNPLQLHLVATR
ncbi:MAG TPA: RidA family protein [Chloroflexota bacterium]|nr:RidA family protein [Chloroflexota bacterium]